MHSGTRITPCNNTSIPDKHGAPMATTECRLCDQSFMGRLLATFDTHGVSSRALGEPQPTSLMHNGFEFQRQLYAKSSAAHRREPIQRRFQQANHLSLQENVSKNQWHTCHICADRRTSQKIHETLLTAKRVCCLNRPVETHLAPRPTGRQQFLIEDEAQQGNLMRFFVSLLQSLAGLQDLVPFRLFDNVVLERETQAAESWRIAFGCSQE